MALERPNVPRLREALTAMSRLIEHRGPDGHGIWTADDDAVGLAHRRLSIIDLSEVAAQPMVNRDASVITYNGEIYNYRELRRALESQYAFGTDSDTEVLLSAYQVHGEACVDHLRGMFAFAIWDERRKSLFAARDRFGIKPFYYAVVDGILYFASEAKSLMPLLPRIETSPNAMSEYLTFQLVLGEETMFSGIQQLMPGYALRVADGELVIWRYWDVEFAVDHEHSAYYFENLTRERVLDSIDLHLRSDVEVGSYVSGGIDSSLVHVLASERQPEPAKAFHGRFPGFPDFDESRFAQAAVERSGGRLITCDITAADFVESLDRVIYHLDFPTAGPGSFPQYMVSGLAAEHVKVVLGGQGGDEVFGGYARYLLAYLEQCLKAAIEGTYESGNYVVTLESIIPSLKLLREYKPLIQSFWADGLFEPMDRRYFALVNRARDMKNEINWEAVDDDRVTEQFSRIFDNDVVRHDAYFDKMTYFDFKTLLPALLHVEDRMSMAHGLESRVPLLDHPLVEAAASAPANVKFDGGSLKNLLKQAFREEIPSEILGREDKMGFPVPLAEWFSTDVRECALGQIESLRDRELPFFQSAALTERLDTSGKFSRKTWALMSLEAWFANYHDRERDYQLLLIDSV